MRGTRRSWQCQSCKQGHVCDERANQSQYVGRRSPLPPPTLAPTWSPAFPVFHRSSFRWHQFGNALTTPVRTEDEYVLGHMPDHILCRARLDELAVHPRLQGHVAGIGERSRRHETWPQGAKLVKACVVSVTGRAGAQSAPGRARSGRHHVLSEASPCTDAKSPRFWPRPPRSVPPPPEANHWRLTRPPSLQWTSSRVAGRPHGVHVSQSSPSVVFTHPSSNPTGSTGSGAFAR